MNPLYEQLGELAKQIVIQTMMEGEATHPDKPVDGWKDKNVEYHLSHLMAHADSAYFNDKPKEDDVAHALTRCAMIKHLQQPPQYPCDSCGLSHIPFGCQGGCGKLQEYYIAVSQNKDSR